MASDFNYQRDHSRAFYAPADNGTVKKGQVFWCHQPDDEQRAREQGFTSKSYVRSEWPKTAYHKKTGQTKPVGKLEWDNDKNMAALAEMGPDWGLDHVAVPEPVEAAPAGATPEIGSILTFMTDQFARINARLDEQDQAILEMASAPDPKAKK